MRRDTFLRSLAALADLGVEPAAETLRLRRLVRGG